MNLTSKKWISSCYGSRVCCFFGSLVRLWWCTVVYEYYGDSMDVVRQSSETVVFYGISAVVLPWCFSWFGECVRSVRRLNPVSSRPIWGSSLIRHDGDWPRTADEEEKGSWDGGDWWPYRTHAKVHNITTIIEEKQQQNAMIFREALALIGFLFGWRGSLALMSVF